MSRFERIWVCAWLLLALAGVIGWMWQQPRIERPLSALASVR